MLIPGAVWALLIFISCSCPLFLWVSLNPTMRTAQPKSWSSKTIKQIHECFLHNTHLSYVNIIVMFFSFNINNTFVLEKGFFSQVFQKLNNQIKVTVQNRLYSVPYVWCPLERTSWTGRTLGKSLHGLGRNLQTEIIKLGSSR